MKKLFSFILMLFVSVITYSQAQFKWDATFFDFKTIQEGKPATYDFTFTNTGNQPLIILNANGSCECTHATFPKEPILPGKKGKITVSYDSKGHVYPFQKSVFVMSNVKENGKSKVVELKIKGEVVK